MKQFIQYKKTPFAATMSQDPLLREGYTQIFMSYTHITLITLMPGN